MSRSTAVGRTLAQMLTNCKAQYEAANKAVNSAGLAAEDLVEHLKDTDAWGPDAEEAVSRVARAGSA